MRETLRINSRLVILFLISGDARSVLRMSIEYISRTVVSGAGHDTEWVGTSAQPTRLPLPFPGAATFAEAELGLIARPVVVRKARHDGPPRPAAGALGELEPAQELATGRHERRHAPRLRQPGGPDRKNS